ncbi:Zinc ribbon domain-containing protein, partial [Dysosmobacter welbionis]
ALRLLQVLRHVVEGGRQLSQLVIPAVVVHADVEVPLRIAAGGLGHLPDGLDLPHGGDGGRHEGDHQHHERRHEEQPDEA